MSEVPFVAEATFRVRYAETDAQGIVHHASYIVYFEEGRSEYIRQRGLSYAEIERGGLFLAVTEIQARYLKAARYDDLLTVKCRVSKARSRSLKFEYEIIHADTGDRLLTGSSTHVFLNRDGEIVRTPKEWLTWADS